MGYQNTDAAVVTLKIDNRPWYANASICIFAFPSFLFLVAESTCNVNYQKLGCYQDTTKKPRLLEKLILTDRDSKSAVFSNVTVDWGNWDSYIRSLACRCAKKAAENKYNYFGLQHYGKYAAINLP